MNPIKLQLEIGPEQIQQIARSKEGAGQYA